MLCVILRAVSRIRSPDTHLGTIIRMGLTRAQKSPMHWCMGFRPSGARGLVTRHRVVNPDNLIGGGGLIKKVSVLSSANHKIHCRVESRYRAKVQGGCVDFVDDDDEHVLSLLG